MVRKRRRSGDRLAGRWKRLFLVFCFSIAGVCFISLLVGFFVAKSYLEGDAFRSTMEDAAQRNLKVDQVKIKSLNFDGAHVGTAGLVIETGGWLRLLSVTGLDVSIDRGALWDRLLRLEDITFNQVKLEVDLNRLDVPPPEFPEEAETFFSRFAPKKAVFDKLNIKQFSALMDYDGKNYILENARLKLVPVSQGKEMIVDMTGGRFILPYSWLKIVDLGQLSLRYHPDRVTLLRSKSKINPGEMEIEGEWVKSTNTWGGSLIIRNAELARFLELDWQKQFTGKLFWTARLKGGVQGLSDMRASIKVEKARVTGLPFLDKLAAFVNTARFRSIDFNEAHAQVSFDGQVWSIDDVVLASEGLVRVEGELSIDEKKNLKGSLLLGLPAGLLAHIPGAEEQIFLASNNDGKMGLLWARVNLSGTLDDIQEDLSARMLTAASARMFEKVEGSGTKVLNYTRSIADRVLEQAVGPRLEPDKKSEELEKEDLDSGPNGGIDRIKEAGDLLSPLKSIF